MNVAIKHLRAFVAVARQGSFTRAAQARLLSQPALTLIINQLEDQLGLKLFDRTTRRVRLTEAGADFLPTAERLLEDFDTALADMRAISERRRGRVSIVALPSIAIRVLPDIIARFTEAYPRISVHLYDANASAVQRSVARSEVDFGIGSRWQDVAELDFRPLLRDPFGAVCRSDHPLAASKSPLSWVDLDGYPFIGLGRDTGIRPLVDRVRGAPANVAAPQYEVSNIATLQGLLHAGLGITALPALAIPNTESSKLIFRPLMNPVVEREICLISRNGRSLSPAAQSMNDLVCEKFLTYSISAIIKS